MLRKVDAFCWEHHLFEYGDTILVACSGGPDSLALLHVFLTLKEKYNLHLHVAHLDHMFRGEASKADAVFVQQFCEVWALPYTVRTVDVPDYAQKRAMSDEAAAREVRYAFLRDVAAGIDSKGGQVHIATAHHADDQAETVLLHLFRGAGSEGLAAICPAEAGIIRPFLGITRFEIEAYCEKKGLLPRHDATNDIPNYMRNKLRLQLLPQLRREYNPAITQALCRSAVLARSEHDFIHKTAQALWSKIVQEKKDRLLILRAPFISLHTALQREILRLAVECVAGSLKNITFLHMEELNALVRQGRVGKGIDLPGGVRGYCSYEGIELVQKRLFSGSGDFSIVLCVPGKTGIPVFGIEVITELVTKAEKLENHKNCILCDSAKLKAPFIVRSRRDGDRFDCGNGTKKIKDFFIDAKIERNQRDKIPLFCDGQGIFWIGGCRQTALGKVTEKTTRFLRLTIQRSSSNASGEE
ncbi:MAG: tRNA lysidine(34) synthetase TilS [Selenomonadaceae bacterium]